MIDKLKTILKSNIFKHAGTYTFFNVFDRAIPFLLLPIITRHISPSEYGNYAMFQAILPIAVPFISLNCGEGVVRNFFSLKNKRDFSIYFSNSLLILLVATISSILIVYCFNNFFEKVINFPSEWILITLAIGFFQTFSRLNLSLYQIAKKPKNYGIYKIILTFLKFSLMILFLVYFNKNWQGLIIAQLISIIIVSTYSLYYFKKNGFFIFKINKNYLKDNFKIGFPLIFHKIGGWLNSFAGRIIINSLLGTAATGNYSIGATFGIIIALLQDSFNLAFTPILFEKLSNVINIKEKKRIVRFTYMYHIGIITLAIIVGLIGANLVKFIFGPEFIGAKKFVLLTCVAFAFNGSYKMHVNYIFFQKKTHITATITVISGLVNVLLTYVLIKTNGEIGVAQALVISNALSFILAWYLANKVYPMPWFSANINRS
ncbi:MAG: oligosaccharide flippase family protein [Bacteroidales bacterium]|nr:oligosaccharide flippase family protein [Bacteroidales bacterium]